jgi:hypothetical protein
MVGAVQFSVVKAAADAGPVFPRLRDAVRQWISRADLDSDAHFELPAGGKFQWPGDQEIELSLAGDEKGVAVWTCLWSHPSSEGPTVRRREKIQIGQVEPGEAQLEIVQYAIREDGLEEGLILPPACIELPARIVEGFSCNLGNRPIRASPHLVTDDNVVSFVGQDLTSKIRRLPLVLISKDPKDGGSTLDAARLARMLAGLGEVYLLQDHAVALGLSDLVPRRLACLNGSYRIYLPGFDLNSNPLDHRLTLKETVAGWRRAGIDAEAHILAKMGQSSALAYAEGATIQQARRTLRQRLEQHLLEQRRTRGDLEAQVVLLREALQQKESLVEGLELELEGQRRLWIEYQRTLPPSGEGPPSAEEPPLPEFSSVGAALEYAAELWPVDVCVLRSALDSARATESRRRTEVFTAISAVRDLAIQSFAGVAFGDNIEHLVKLRYNLRYRAQDHKATVDAYGDYRRFLYNGQKILFENHITIGPNSESCLQLYFLLDPQARKVVIGYCGKHLPTKGWVS